MPAFLNWKIKEEIPVEHTHKGSLEYSHLEKASPPDEETYVQEIFEK